jgi:predicted phosphohydrolase
MTMHQTNRNRSKPALTTQESKKIAWMSDLHLDKADASATSKLIKELKNSDYDLALVTGDISSYKNLAEHLNLLAKACGARPLYLTLGNHDYYGSSIASTGQLISKLCRAIPNLHHLDAEDGVSLGNQTILIGTDGWADAQWRGQRTKNISSPDHYSIEDFRKLGNWDRIGLMRELGRKSANKVGIKLKAKFKSARKCIVASHVPPFRTSAIFSGKPCDPDHQPHYVHAKLGATLIWFAERNPKAEILALSGHTHTYCEDHVLPNLTSIVGEHRRNQPRIQQILAA